MNLKTFTFTEEPRHIDHLTVHRVGKMVIVDGKRKRIFSNENDGEFFKINKIPFYAMDSRMHPPSVFVVCPWRNQWIRTHADYVDNLRSDRRTAGARTRTQVRECYKIKNAFKFMEVLADCEHYKRGELRRQLIKPLRHVPPPSTFSEILGQVTDKTWAIEYHMAQLLANLPPAPVVAHPVVSPPLVVAPTTTRTPTKKPAKGYRIKACNRSGYGGQYLSPERLAIDARCALRVAKYNLLHQPTPTVQPPTPTVPPPTVQPPTPTIPTPTVQPPTPTVPPPTVQPPTPTVPPPTVQPPTVQPPTPTIPTPTVQPPTVQPPTPTIPTPTVQPPTPTIPTPTVQPPTATKKRPWQMKTYKYPPMGSDAGRIMYFMVRNGFTPCAESVKHPFGLNVCLLADVVYP
jgi:hypothetical protein